MPTLLITGANRGIGLEMARQYSQDGWTVVATCRDPEGAGELQTLAREEGSLVEIHPLSVTDGEGLAALARRLEGRPWW